MRDNRPGKGKGSRDGGVAETMKYRMPTYERGPNRVAMNFKKPLSAGRGTGVKK